MAHYVLRHHAYNIFIDIPAKYGTADAIPTGIERRMNAALL